MSAPCIVHPELDPGRPPRVRIAADLEELLDDADVSGMAARKAEFHTTVELSQRLK